MPVEREESEEFGDLGNERGLRATAPNEVGFPGEVGAASSIGEENGVGEESRIFDGVEANLWVGHGLWHSVILSGEAVNKFERTYIISHGSKPGEGFCIWV